jgi:hypothetical protein
LVLVAQRLWQRADEVEQSRTAWRDMGAVLDVVIGPEPLGGGVVALVEKGLECFEDDGLILFGRGLEWWLGLAEQFFRFDKWNPCRGDENDGPAKRDRLNSFFT